MNSPLNLEGQEKLPEDNKFIEVCYNDKYHAYDVSILSLDTLALFDFVEIDLSFFPLSRRVSSEEYTFEPFEHHIDDSKSKISAYRTMSDLRKVLSGIGTSALLTGIAYKFNAKNIGEVESLLAIGTTYYMGTKAWPDIEAALINTTGKSRLQFKERYYNYTLKQASTAERYDNYAQRKRFGIARIDPINIGMVTGPSRQKVRLRFTKDEFLGLIGANVEKANILSINLPNDELVKPLLESGVQIGVHIKLGRRPKLLPFVDVRTELIQTLITKKDGTYEVGCIPDDTGILKPGDMEIRETVSINRIKYYKSFDHEPYQIMSYRANGHDHSNGNGHNTTSADKQTDQHAIEEPAENGNVNNN